MSIKNRFGKDPLSETQRATLTRYKKQLYKTLTAIRKNRLGLLGVIVLASFVFIAVFAPQLAPYDPSRTFTDEVGQVERLEPPNWKHPMGTTHLGRDVFSQWIWGSRVALLVGFAAGASVVIVGTTIGLVAGYYKGITDLVLMRLVDMMYGIPTTPFILVLALLYGASVWNIILAFVLVLWRTMARLVRAQTLSLSERPFIKSARSTGASDRRIIFYHIAPNIVPLMFTEATIIMGDAIVIEAGVSFLGLGATEMISWGTMLQLTFVTGAIREAWWWVIPPGFSITLLVMSFFYISRALEDVTNPELQEAARR